MNIMKKLRSLFFPCKTRLTPEPAGLFGEQLTIRGRMAYGLACLSAYLRYHGMNHRQYKQEIGMLATFTSSHDLPRWELETKEFLFGRYSEEQCARGLPHLFELLYYVGAGDMYGKYSGASARELYLVVEALREDGIPLPDESLFEEYSLTSRSEDDCFGSPFDCPEYFL